MVHWNNSITNHWDLLSSYNAPGIVSKLFTYIIILILQQSFRVGKIIPILKMRRLN